MITSLPNSKAAWVRCGLIAVVLLAVAMYRNVFSLGQLAVYEPQDGDIVFQSLPHGDLVDAIEGVSQAPWSHCGVVVFEQGRWRVAESIGHVRKTPLPLWIMRGRKGVFEVYRANNALAAPETLHAALDRYLGRPYDFHYVPGSDQIYCSELVVLAYQEAFGFEVGRWQRLGDLNWQPHEAFIRSMENGNLPLERPIITPIELTRSALLHRVYPKNTESANENKSSG